MQSNYYYLYLILMMLAILSTFLVVSTVCFSFPFTMSNPLEEKLIFEENQIKILKLIIKIKAETPNHVQSCKPHYIDQPTGPVDCVFEYKDFPFNFHIWCTPFGALFVEFPSLDKNLHQFNEYLEIPEMISQLMENQKSLKFNQFVHFISLAKQFNSPESVKISNLKTTMDFRRGNMHKKAPHVIQRKRVEVEVDKKEDDEIDMNPVDDEFYSTDTRSLKITIKPLLTQNPNDYVITLEDETIKCNLNFNTTNFYLNYVNSMSKLDVFRNLFNRFTVSQRKTLKRRHY
jgi:hypothetical protein